MEETLLQRRPAPQVAAGLFIDPPCLHDAIADLREAGFTDLSIAFSKEAKEAQKDNPKARHARESALHGEKHSLPWRVRHGVEEDSHHRGPEILAGEGAAGSADCPEVDLEETLLQMGVPQFRIDLVSREIGASGALLLVQAGSRSEEAQAIIEKNCGINRTDTATEHAPAAAFDSPKSAPAQ